jgi:hypothetical protein
LRKNPNAGLAVFAVWEPMLPTDMSAPSTSTLARLSDARVRQFYDSDHLIAKRLKDDARPPQPTPDCCTRGEILWDLMAIYPAGNRWEERIPAAITFNGPVVDVIAELEKALTVFRTPH